MIKLTSLSKGSGCGCKIAPALLEKILSNHAPSVIFENLVVGYESKDDAAVYRLPGSDQYLISTVDFFTPVVDDPFDFGRIAAANALSDIYAMGGTPLLATAILGLPVEKIPVEIAQQIVSGGRHTCHKAGIPLAGGHSIDSPEPFFGLSVNGLVHKNHLRKNNTAKPGDHLFITKPLGTGIISAAVKRGTCSPQHLAKAVEVMTELNIIGEKLGRVEGVNAITDVTGFGLLGHLIEMAEGSNCAAELIYSQIPLITGIEEYISKLVFPDNVYRNWNAYEKKVKGINGPEFITLCDPQTNGGLLVAVDPGNLTEFNTLIKMEGLTSAYHPVGEMREERGVLVELKG